MNEIESKEKRPAFHGSEYNEEQKNGIEKVENFSDGKQYMIKHFVNALNHLVLIEMDGKEWANKKDRQPKIIPYYKDINGEVIINFDTSDFLINKPFPLIKGVDAYGSAIYNVNGIYVTLLNTYGEDDDIAERYPANSKYVPILPICYIYDKYVEVADIVILKSIMPRKRFSIQNHMIGIIPEELRELEFGGKRAFYFYPNERFVSLRVKSKDYKSISQVYRHKDSEDWISTPRIKVHLQPSI